MPAPVSSKKHLYEVLGLTDDASEDAIRVAYKKLALKWHPDRHQDDKEAAQEKFIEIKEAYNTLLESRKRSKRSKRPQTAPTAPPSTAPSTSSSHSASSSGSASSTSSSSSSRPSSSKTPESHDPSSHRASDKRETKHSGLHEQRSERLREEKQSTRHKSDSNFTPRPKVNKPSTPFSHLDSDSSSDEEDNGHHTKHKNHKDAFRSHSSSQKKFRPIEEDGYEFIDFGSPLQPLRAPSVKNSVKSGKSGDLSKDWIFPLQMSLDDLYHGASHHYRIIRTLRSGKTQTVKIDIRVEPGWQKGIRIRVPSVGNERKDGSFQDIVFVVEEQSHPQFLRIDDDLYVTIQVPWAETLSRPYSWSSMDSRLDGDPPSKEELAFVKGLNGEEYGLPIPVSLVEGADGTRVVGAGMPIRKKGEVVGKGDLVIRWEFIFPETDKVQQSRWQSLKKRAMGWKL